MKRWNKKQNRKGFTMIELMVVVVVVGVLAAIAVPMYGKYVKNARVTEATAQIGEIITSAKAYAAENGDWPALGEGMLDAAPATDNFTYTVTGADGDATTDAYTVTATGANNMAGVTVAITVTDVNSNGGAPVVSGL
jgi:prepilin-type N-terminal cleavage/methylation domain-containing protein